MESDSSIVKKIWQTWKTSKVPEVARLPFISWSVNDGWERFFKNDKEINKFIRVNFPRLFRVYRTLPFGVMKADIWRYCVIYKHGGLYTDLDTSCVKKLDDWIPKDAQFVVSGEKHTELFCQWTFYAAPNCYIMKRMVNFLFKRLNNVTFFREMVHYYTGPTFFTLAIVVAIKEMLMMEGHVELSKNIDSRLLRKVPRMPDNHPLKAFLLKHKIYILPINVFNSIYVKHHFGGSKWTNHDYVPWKIHKNNYLQQREIEKWNNRRGIRKSKIV